MSNKDTKKVLDKIPMYSLVEVDWEDITTATGWTSDEGIIDKAFVSKCHSIGYITKKTEGMLTLSATVGVDEGFREWNQHITIPIGCITCIDKH